VTDRATATCGGAGAAGDAERRFLVYSVTKSYLAVLALLLADERRLDLDDPVTGWVDDPRLPDVPLRRLLDHTAGIPDYGRLPEYRGAVRAAPGEAWSDAELLGRALERGLDFPPGAGWAYSNTGYLLLRLVLEAVTGDVAGALAVRILEPLGLTRTSLAATPTDLAGLVPAASADLGVEDVRGVYDPRWVGHRALVSTAADTCRFFAALTGGRLLGRPAWEELTTLVDVPVEVGWMRRPSYGLGVMADPEHALGLVLGHGGGGPGYTAAAFAVEGRAAVVLEAREGPGVEQEALELLAGA
jgi:D-alanyl-D-alanine carboxypeptidase